MTISCSSHVGEVIESVLIRLRSAEATLCAARILAKSGQQVIAEQMVREARNILKGLIYEKQLPTD